MTDTKVVTRFAPSPTGLLHVGAVRTALYAFLFAKKNNGTFILRIEDTDKEREVPGSIEHIIESLKWLGITWDEGVDIGGKNSPYIQSERLESYKKYADILVESGHAYADPYGKEELETFREKAKENNKPFLYRNHRPDNPPKWDGTMPLRFKIDKLDKVSWHDEVRGDLSAGAESLDDFILIKSDGYPTYNFAHIIDDLEMGVTHVMRADEFISSTPKFIALYEALGIERPKLVTLPPILGESGTKKLGKRDGAKDVLDYQKDGYLPSALINFLALQGWNPGTEKEIFTFDELIETFSIEKIQKSGAHWNEEKLLWVNKEHIKKLSYKEQFDLVKKSIPNYIVVSDEKLAKVLPQIIERIQLTSEIKKFIDEGEFIYFFLAPIIENSEILNWKKDNNKENTKNRLILTQDLLSQTEKIFFEDPEHIKKVLAQITEKEGKGEVLWPLRTALSGREKSSDPFTIISIIGKEETLSRIASAIESIQNHE